MFAPPSLPPSLPPSDLDPLFLGLSIPAGILFIVCCCAAYNLIRDARDDGSNGPEFAGMMICLYSSPCLCAFTALCIVMIVVGSNNMDGDQSATAQNMIIVGGALIVGAPCFGCVLHCMCETPDSGECCGSGNNWEGNGVVCDSGVSVCDACCRTLECVRFTLCWPCLRARMKADREKRREEVIEQHQQHQQKRKASPPQATGGGVPQHNTEINPVVVDVASTDGDAAAASAMPGSARELARSQKATETQKSLLIEVQKASDDV